ncbi:carboxymuconolactone decarboxylase family protein [Isoptericola sp. S6320L]|uniref:carboxymuconolactone decarboxylase family protein n=1 Tax=Isoptericola sp. S6320L TaxID=2926411 RepID=UPI001FF1FFBB|nr:carboxymuconolactone decarboxylase family protein [Isoptericola sp. S6320L]MCK0118558.1 carboxymuconolactone decarboxylase family protein [Isoptericola sp. S6320L]
MDRLRRFAVNPPSLELDLERDPEALGPRTASIARLAALVAVGGAVPTYGSLVDEAVSAGATPAEIVDVLTAVVAVVGLPRIVAAAPKLALALGQDLFGDDGSDGSGTPR